ncbi:hypothetical protein Bbelb_018740 [Branchiostoma belcheri]|nr:hypothetical protein Bbelb_018740 [Branchiostoma belcheri]
MAEERQCSNLPKARTKLQHFRQQSSINGSTYKGSESSACNLKPQCHSPHSWLANGQTVEKAETASIKELISKATGKTGVEEFYRLKIHVPDRFVPKMMHLTAVRFLCAFEDRHYWYPCPVGADTCDKSTADNRLVSIKVPIGCGWTPERIFVFGRVMDIVIPADLDEWTGTIIISKETENIDALLNQLEEDLTDKRRPVWRLIRDWAFPSWEAQEPFDPVVKLRRIKIVNFQGQPWDDPNLSLPSVQEVASGSVQASAADVRFTDPNTVSQGACFSDHVGHWRGEDIERAAGIAEDTATRCLPTTSTSVWVGRHTTSKPQLRQVPGRFMMSPSMSLLTSNKTPRESTKASSWETMRFLCVNGSSTFRSEEPSSSAEDFK